MAITSTLPARTARELKRELYENTPHQAVWSLQKALGITADGYFGPQTESSTKQFQSRNNLYVDGIAGQKTQSKVVKLASDKAEVTYKLPNGLIDGIWQGEGGGYLAPVNWAVAGGVDAGPIQQRVYDLRPSGSSWPLIKDSNGNVLGPTADLVRAVRFDQAKVEEALNANVRTKTLGADLRELKDKFYVRRLAPGAPGPGTYGNNQRSWSCAVLDHNWPAAAEKLSYGWQLPNKIATWVPPSVRATGVDTWAEWAEWYMKTMTRFVTNWTP